MDSETTLMITPSEVIEHLYCPRFTYFMNCLNIPQHEELRYKVLRGRGVHEDRLKRNAGYVRKRLNCIVRETNVYLASVNIHVRGVVDEVLYLADGSMAPMDYKFTEFREYLFNTHKIQSTIYAMLIKETYNKVVTKGYICYVRSGAKVKEIAFSKEHFKKAMNVLEEIFDVIERGYYPKKTPFRLRCIDCCYKNICV